MNMPTVRMIATRIAHYEYRALPQRRSHSAVVHPHAVRMVAAVRGTQISRRVGFQGTRAPSPVSSILLPFLHPPFRALSSSATQTMAFVRETRFSVCG